MHDHISSILIIVYLTLSFVYSAIEKLVQWEGSISYYKEHFKTTFLKNHIPKAMILVALMEILSVGLNISGLYQLWISGDTTLANCGLLAVSLTLIVLMTGQRIAQNFSGAMSVTVYFILAVFGLYVLNHP